MPRSVLVVTSAILALLSPLAQAKKNELRTYAFTSDDCNGPSIGGNKDLKQDKCEDIVFGANSIRVFANKYQDWIAQINNGKQRCFINTYQYHGCKGTPTVIEELPHSIDECITPYEQTLSVLFGCSPREPETDSDEPHVVTVTETGPGYLTTWMHTSNSLTKFISSILTTSVKTQHPTTSTVTVVPASTVTVVPQPINPVQTVTMLPAPTAPLQTITALLSSPLHTVTVYVEDSYQRERRSDPQPESRDLEPRRKSKWKGPRIGVWMKHPWTQAIICYECYAKAPDNTFKFECRSGPKNPIQCSGKMPDPEEIITVTHTPGITITQGEPITRVSVVTVTAGQASPAPAVTTKSVLTMVGGKPVYTIIDQSMQTITLSQKEAALDPRGSFHRAVRFTHPWYPDTEMCADAEWEKRGKDNAEIRIQKPKEDMKKCEKDRQVQLIDAFPRTSTYNLPTRTVSMIISTSTVYPPSVITVNPSPPMITVTTITGPVPAPPTVTITTITAPEYSTVTHIFDPARPVYHIVDPAPAYSITTVTVDPEPECTTVTVEPEPECTTVTVEPEPEYTTVTVEPEPECTTVTVEPEPEYTTVTTDPEPDCSTVTVIPGVAPMSYTTVYQDRRQLRDL